MSVDIRVMNEDGSTGTATDQQRALLGGAQRVLQADSHFQALKEPALSRAEINAGLPDTEAGYLYLRYDVPGTTPQEFWAHWGKADRVAWKSGNVTVKAAD